MEKQVRYGVAEQLRSELRRTVSQLKETENAKCESYIPTSAILIGGGGHMGQRYGRLFDQAGLPVSAIIDKAPKSQAIKDEIPNVNYLQLTDDKQLEDSTRRALDEFANAAVFITTPQGTHMSILERLAPLLRERRVPIRIEKPLAANLAELKKFFDLAERYPGITTQMVAGGYTIDKATPELFTLGVFPINDSVRHIKPVDSQTPDFTNTYFNPYLNAKKFGKLKHIGFHFHEGRADIRDVVGEKFGDRTYLAMYPNGGMVGDLTDHVADKLATAGYLKPESSIFSIYLGYIPIGASEVSFPWKVPKGSNGLAEFEVETSLKTDNIPIVLSWGKREPEFLGDKRKSTLYFDNATLSTDYTKNERGQSNIFTIKTTDGQQHSYYLDVDPWILMLERFKKAWSNSSQGIRGVYPQVLTSLFQADIFNAWKKEPTIFFQTDPRIRVRNSEIEERQLQKMRRDEKVVRSHLNK